GGNRLKRSDANEIAMDTIKQLEEIILEARKNIQASPNFAWFELIDKAKADKKGIVFVTADQKIDWWRQFRNKPIGVRPELVEEMKQKTGQFFLMYSVQGFLKAAQKELEQAVEKRAVKEGAGLRGGR